MIWQSRVQKKTFKNQQDLNLPFPNLNCHAQQGSDKEFVNMWKESLLDALKMSSIHY